MDNEKAMDCLFFVQVRGEIWIPRWLYADEEEMEAAVNACLQTFGVPVRVISSPCASRCPVCQDESRGVGI